MHELIDHIVANQSQAGLTILLNDLHYLVSRKSDIKRIVGAIKDLVGGPIDDFGPIALQLLIESQAFKSFYFRKV